MRYWPIKTEGISAICVCVCVDVRVCYVCKGCAMCVRGCCACRFMSGRVEGWSLTP